MQIAAGDSRLSEVSCTSGHLTGGKENGAIVHREGGGFTNGLTLLVASGETAILR